MHAATFDGGGMHRRPRRLAFSTPQGLHQFCRPREYALILATQLHDPAHQSLDAARTPLLQQSPSRRRGLDQLHTAIAGVTHTTHKTSPL